jgi:hypothetical protein
LFHSLPLFIVVLYHFLPIVQAEKAQLILHANFFHQKLKTNFYVVFKIWFTLFPLNAK